MSRVPGSVRVVLAHGASGTSASMRPHVEGLRRRGFEAVAIDLPKRTAEDAVPAYRAALAELGPTDGATVIGGHSYGGRVASLLVAAEPELARGLLLLSFPLHRPGAPDTWQGRAAHLPRIRCPVLMLSGERDPFARLEHLRTAAAKIPEARLRTWPGVRHGLIPVLDEALDEAAAWLEALGGRGRARIAASESPGAPGA
jgi:predicted alpha/beta-hydrolase family hydrolase